MSKSLHERATEVIAKVLELDNNTAIQKIEDECRGDKELKKEVLNLYNEIRQEEEALTGLPVMKTTSDKTTLTRLRREEQATMRFVKGWTKKVFANKRVRLVFFGLFLAFLLVFGLGIRWQVKNILIKNQEENLSGQLHAQYLRLNKWIEETKIIVESIAKDSVVVDIAARLDKVRLEDPTLESLKNNQLIKQTQKQYRYSANYRNIPIGIISKDDARILMALNQQREYRSTNVGIRLGKNVYNAYLQAMTGTSFVKPLSNEETIYNNTGIEEPSVVCVFMTPVKNSAGELVGVMYAAYPAEGEFSKILSRLHYGKKGESYAFDKQGRMLSASRYTEDLRNTPLMNNTDDEETIYNITLKDPGGNLLNGYVPTIPFTDMSLILPVKQAINERNTGADSIAYGAVLSGSRNYYGVNVLSKWLWWREYDFGIVVETPLKEALKTLKYFDYVLVVLFVLIFVLSFLLFNSNIRIAQFGKKIEDFSQLGQYKLKEKLGEGGFGEVFKAEHSFLKTPVAIKLLKKEFNKTDLLERFEREVKFTSMLQHPNTIQVFDYGTTKNEQFYYVMEYLDGISLDKVVQSHQPFPLGRAIHVLLHTCLSLKEAHGNGLIHRDIKPQNIMLCNKGGEFDVVKVLDFGLVKNIETKNTRHTQINRIGGTPMFMAPERLRDPFNNDRRVDIYSVGAVGVYMFSGQMVLELISQKMLSGQQSLDIEIKQQIIEREDVPVELKELIYQCLDFNASLRPEDMNAVIVKLEELAAMYPWTRNDAIHWWKKYDVYL